jgi:lipoprotein-anchoring transpeptidase ErfK/SrfK
LRQNAAVVTRGAGIRTALLAVVAGAVLALPASAAHAATGISVDVNAPKKADLLEKLQIKGSVINPAPGEVVTVTVTASGRELFKKKVTPGSGGSFAMPLVVDACCGYVISAESGGRTANDGFQVSVPKHLGKGEETALFNQALQDQGFHTGTKGGRVTLGTRLAIKAFRKTNGMRRSEAYDPTIFRALLQGKGAFQVQYPNDGRHVEVDISHQVMSLIEGDTPVHTFHVSTGAGGTPTIRGNFRFYLRQAGYNAKRMYYSIYFHGGYATHGYNPVPNHPASHGCVRNPIPFSRFIYNWVQIGMPVHVYE